MESVLALGLVIVGLIVLCLGGYTLVLGGVALAKKLQISSMVIGLTVVAYGTSTPELAASITAAVNSHTDLILGNIVGSNISNVGMVIGVSAETDNLDKYAKKKLSEKNCDWIIANDVSDTTIGFDSDFNEVSIFYKNMKYEKIPEMKKSLLADNIVKKVISYLN